jgi:N-acetylneuraminic acid mutarotase
MPAQASATSVCVVDGILYVIGGNYPYPKPLRTVWAYDPQTDSWTRKADMPTARNFLAATAVDGTIYVIGGFPGGAPLKTVEAYDPKTDTWVTKASMPTGRAGLAACAVGGIIYAIGGFASWPNPLSMVEAYDPKSDQWTKKSNLPKGLLFVTASVADGRIYAFMGTETFAYDPKTDRWTTKARYSPWSFGQSSGTVDGVIYLFGGITEDMYGSFDFTLAYDPAQDQFTARRKMPKMGLVGGCGVIDGKIYLAAGVSKEPVLNSDAVYYRRLDVFDPQGGVMPWILSTALESTNRLRLVWQAEAGMKYGVDSSSEVPTNHWTRVTLPAGLTVTSTNGVVETSCPVVPGEPRRFFRVFEAGY